MKPVYSILFFFPLFSPFFSHAHISKNQNLLTRSSAPSTATSSPWRSVVDSYNSLHDDEEADSDVGGSEPGNAGAMEAGAELLGEECLVLFEFRARLLCWYLVSLFIVKFDSKLVLHLRD